MRRIKFQVWSPVQLRWRTAYVRPELLERNIDLMHAAGLNVRVVWRSA